MSQKKDVQKYWKANIRIVLTLLAFWFVISYGCAILFVDELNEIRFYGFKLGFWFAQQGSIYFFVLIIFAYVIAMNRLDRKYGFHEGDE